MEEEITERNKKYAEYVSKITPPSRVWSGLLWAFLIGGVICILGEGLYMLYEAVFPDWLPEHVGGLVAVTLIGGAAILTAFGVYDKIGSFAGGGSIVPITGFSNAMAASAMEHRKEGIIFGACTNMFKIAGPVIVIGVALSMLVGLVYWVIYLVQGVG